MPREKEPEIEVVVRVIAAVVQSIGAAAIEVAVGQTDVVDVVDDCDIIASEATTMML